MCLDLGVQTTPRPGVVMLPTVAKRVLVIELTVPREEGIPAAHEPAAECREAGWTEALWASGLSSFSGLLE